MKTVIAAVDGSAPSLKGVAWAARLARALGAKVELVYVSFPNLLPPAVYAETLVKIEAAEAERAKKVFDASERAVADFDVECVKTRRTGGPAEEIATLAEREDIWGVVVGALGHNALSRMLLGSVADRLAHICPKPVAIIR
jgi:nucleotide-binding universal stress UspA family protein